MTTAILTAGTVVTARPWVKGTERKPQRAIVFTPTWGNESAHALLWFPELGDPAVGRTVMPIVHRDISGADAFNSMPKTFIAQAYTAIRRARRVGGRYGWRDDWAAAADVIETTARRTRR